MESPERVRHDAPWFAAVFSPAAVAPFQREVRGVIRSDNQTVAGMNRIVVVDVRHQSRLHRLFTERPVSRNALHQTRLTRLASLSGTQMTPQGVVSLDETFWTHSGQPVDKMASRDEHTQGCSVWAHHRGTLHDRDDQTAYPSMFQ